MRANGVPRTLEAAWCSPLPTRSSLRPGERATPRRRYAGARTSNWPVASLRDPGPVPWSFRPCPTARIPCCIDTRGTIRRGAERCRQMGERCGVSVEVQLGGVGRTATFWRRLKERTGGVPGQKDSWRGPSQWTVHRTYRCPIPHSGRGTHRPSERHPHARYDDPRRFWRKIGHLACAVLGTDDITKDDAYALVNTRVDVVGGATGARVAGLVLVLVESGRAGLAVEPLAAIVARVDMGWSAGAAARVANFEGLRLKRASRRRL